MKLERPRVGLGSLSQEQQVRVPRIRFQAGGDGSAPQKLSLEQGHPGRGSCSCSGERGPTRLRVLGAPSQGPTDLPPLPRLIIGAEQVIIVRCAGGAQGFPGQLEANTEHTYK